MDELNRRMYLGDPNSERLTDLALAIEDARELGLDVVREFRLAGIQDVDLDSLTDRVYEDVEERLIDQFHCDGGDDFHLSASPSSGDPRTHQWKKLRNALSNLISEDVDDWSAAAWQEMRTLTLHEAKYISEELK